MLFSEPNLFLALCLEGPLLKEYQNLAPSQKKLFVQDHPDYLEELTRGKELFLVKKLPIPFEIEDLEQSRSHFISLARKLLPGSFQPDALIVVGI